MTKPDSREQRLDSLRDELRELEQAAPSAQAEEPPEQPDALPTTDRVSPVASETGPADRRPKVNRRTVAGAVGVIALLVLIHWAPRHFFAAPTAATRCVPAAGTPAPAAKLTSELARQAFATPAAAATPTAAATARDTVSPTATPSRFLVPSATSAPASTQIIPPTPTPTATRGATLTATPTATPTARPTTTPTIQQYRATVMFDFTAIYEGPVGSETATISALKKGTSVYVCAATTNSERIRYQVSLKPCYASEPIGYIHGATLSDPVPSWPQDRITPYPTPQP